MATKIICGERSKGVQGVRGGAHVRAAGAGRLPRHHAAAPGLRGPALRGAPGWRSVPASGPGCAPQVHDHPPPKPSQQTPAVGIALGTAGGGGQRWGDTHPHRTSSREAAGQKVAQSHVLSCLRGDVLFLKQTARHHVTETCKEGGGAGLAFPSSV